MSELQLHPALFEGQTIHTLTIDGQGLKLVEKGRRNGVELAWRDLANGDAALAVALQASVNS